MDREHMKENTEASTRCVFDPPRLVTEVKHVGSGGFTHKLGENSTETIF